MPAGTHLNRDQIESNLSVPGIQRFGKVWNLETRHVKISWYIAVLGPIRSGIHSIQDILTSSLLEERTPGTQVPGLQSFLRNGGRNAILF